MKCCLCFDHAAFSYILSPFFLLQRSLLHSIYERFFYFVKN